MQLIPLLLVTDHDSGGYNMDDSEIGVVLMSVAGFQFLWQVYIYYTLKFSGRKRSLISLF